MAKFSTIAPAALMRRLGLPDAPCVLDVRLAEDRRDLPVVIPTTLLQTYTDLIDCIADLTGKHVVVVCDKGLKLSHGAAAYLRCMGIKAEVLDGGIRAWTAAQLPTIPLSVIPQKAPGSVWVTRNRPKIDRIACPWLIRRFIDPRAQFLFVPASEVLAVGEKYDAIAFDVPGAPWTHQGQTCTFDHLLTGFTLSTTPLERMATVIRGADVNQHSLAPECAGLLAFSVGLSRAFPNDLEQLEASMSLYDAFYRWARDGQGETHDWDET
ncbi:MAG: chromate resistance protein ChrB domain-containing protein [Roseobacter sp.]